MFTALAVMTPEGWQPGIGDPTMMGWLTVGCYFIAALICIFHLLRLISLPSNHVRGLILWTSFALMLIALGINKQLDLQTLLTEFGRKLAHAQGWYEQRQTVQAIFVILLMLIGAAGLLSIAFTFNQTSRRLRLAFFGTTFLVTFVIARAASFHHFDMLIGMDLAGARINWLLELTGIACIALAAGWKLNLPGTPRTVAESI